MVIRNRNEGATLAVVLDALARQHTAVEVVVVDNESDDDSIAVASAAGARVISLARGEFTYGRALNIGIAATTAPVCILLSAHAVPVGPHFVDDCLVPFEDPQVAAVRCTYAGKRADAAAWLHPHVLRRGATVRDVVTRGPLASGCALSRRAWEEVPFDETAAAAEEKLWALAVLDRGWSIVSTCPATYSYVKHQSREQLLEKEHRELRAVEQATGVRLGYLERSLGAAIAALLRAAFVAGPRAAARVTVLEVRRFRLRLRRLS